MASQTPTQSDCVLRLHGCPCGFHGDPVRECSRTPTQVSRYSKRISGPMLNRIDIFVEVPRVDYEKLAGPSESSQDVRRRAEAAREVQRKRFNDTPFLNNVEMGPNEVYRYCQTEESAQSLVQSAMQQMHLSARAYHRILKGVPPDRCRPCGGRHHRHRPRRRGAPIPADAVAVTAPLLTCRDGGLH